MNRREWLQTFLDLADNNAIAMEYRRKLGIRAQKLPTHVKLLSKYRAELEKLKEEERQEQIQKQREEALAKAREVARQRREDAEQRRVLQASESAEDGDAEVGGREGEEATGGSAESTDAADNSEAVGPREDSGDES